MGYTALTAPMSQAAAAELGHFLAQYAIEINGLELWQIGESGRRYRDDPLADTVTAAIGSAGGSMASAGMGAAAAPVVAPIAAPILALIGPAAIVAAMTAAIAMLPVALAGIYHTRKHDGEPMAAVAKGDRIIATELTFDLANVSPKRRKWSEYLLGRFAARHGWQELRGLHYPDQLGAGARALRDPIPWANREGQAPGAGLMSSHKNKAEASPSSGGRVKRTLRDLW